MADGTSSDEVFKRLQSHRGVLGMVVINADGIAIKSSFDDKDLTVQYAALVSHFTTKSRSVVRKLDGENDLRFIRIRSKKYEIIIAPEFDKSGALEYSLVTVQDPSATV